MKEICPILNKPCIEHNCSWWIAKLSYVYRNPHKNEKLGGKDMVPYETKCCAIKLFAGVIPELIARKVEGG